MEKLLAKLKENKVTVIVVVVALLVGAAGGWLGRPERVRTVETVKWKTQIEWKDKIEWKERVVVRYRNQAVTKQETDSDCEEKFDKDTGKMTYRHCKLISKTDSNINNQGGGEASGSGTGSSSGTASNEGESKKDTTKGDLEKFRLTLFGGTSWEGLSLTSAPLSLQYGVGGEYRLFWRVWGGAYVIPTSKQVGLQLSLTF